ncbi:MAG: hypothetical protein AB7K09_11085 [Planctomycetota bacterium]
MPDANDVAYLTDAIEREAGGPVVTIAQAARVARCSIMTIRRALYRGQLVGMRRVTNGPILITVRRLAEWLAAGTSRSLPVNRKLERRAAKAGDGEGVGDEN